MRAIGIIGISFLFFGLTLGEDPTPKSGLNIVPAPSLGKQEQVSALDDSILYKVKFNDEDDDSCPESVSKRIGDADNIDILKLNEEEESENVVWIKTKNQETYYCVIPSVGSDASETSGDDEDKDLLEMSPYELIKPLINRKLCSYRLEQYWTYELCHGQYLRQFHEESSVSKKSGKSQEYVLGKFDAATQLTVTEKEFTDKLALLKEQGKKAPTITIEGNNLPYIEFNFTGGTMCDLNNKPRSTRVMYTCSENSKHELHSIKEVFTCEYEAIVLSPMLCLNKNYKKKSVIEHDIRCFPVGKSTPSKPKDVSEFESGIRSQSKTESLFDGKTIIVDNAEVTPEGVKIQIQIHDPETGGFENLWDPLKSGFSPSAKRAKFINMNTKTSGKADEGLIAEFLTGDLCLQGGTGWWKYEFCYGKKVEQYHEEKGERITSISLGTWHHEDHVKWMSEHPDKKPKRGKTPKMVSHFYSKGDTCPETGKPRSVEVKLKCKFIAGGSPDSVALYLLEPHTCDYVLGIESPFLCHLLNNIDENGLIIKSDVVTDLFKDDDEPDVISSDDDPFSKPDKQFINTFIKITNAMQEAAEDEDDEDEKSPVTEPKEEGRDEL